MKTKIRICPICGKEYSDHPAISRKDNKTEICSKCGTMEAVEEFINEFMINKENDSKYCIFEKRICRYANKKEGTFECNAPSDFAMPCNK